MPTDAEIQAFGQYHHGYIGSNIQLADAKAAALFTVQGGILGYLFSEEAFRAALISSGGREAVVASIACVSLTVAATLAFLVIVPRLRRSNPGPVFFLSVAEYPAAHDYVRALRALSQTDLADAMAKQSYDLAQACSRKYRLLRIAMIVGYISVVSASICILVLKL